MPTDTRFDPRAHLDALLAPLGLDPADTGGEIRFAGEDPIFASRHRLGACIGLPMMGCAVGAAAIGRARGLPGQDLHLDLRQAIHGINPEHAWHPTINGEEYPHATVADNPFLLEPFRTRDGRWVMAAGVYPHMVADWFRFFGCTSSEEEARAAIATWDAEPLEDAAAKAGLPLAICRTPEEWEAHPQGALLAASPVITLRRIAAGPPVPWTRARRPLAGVRVLAFVHAVAGCVVGRTLAEQGADVLAVTFPNHFEHDFIYDEANVGSRSCYLNLNDPVARARCLELVRAADVVVDNHRGRTLWAFGLSPEQLAEARPGIVAVSVRAYGIEGPWVDRGGFDMNGSAASGLMVIEGSPDAPRLPPTGMINDFITGYMGALGATAALLRRSREGGSYHVVVSLTRNAMWYRSLGLVDPAKAGATEAQRTREPAAITRETPFGVVHRLAPPISWSHTSGRWDDPILVVRGSSKPAWNPVDDGSVRSRVLLALDHPAVAASVPPALLARVKKGLATSSAPAPAARAAARDASSWQEVLVAARRFVDDIDRSRIRDENLRIQFRLEGQGSLALVIERGDARLVEGEVESPSVALSMSSATFRDLMSRETSASRAYFTGKLRLQGDKMAAKRLLSFVTAPAG
jgi:putative sterol carrier protein